LVSEAIYLGLQWTSNYLIFLSIELFPNLDSIKTAIPVEAYLASQLACPKKLMIFFLSRSRCVSTVMI